MNHIKIKQTVTFQKEFEDKYNADRNYCKVRDHCILQVNAEVLRIIYVTYNA